MRTKDQQASQNCPMYRAQFRQPSEERKAADDEIMVSLQRVRILFSFQKIFFILVYNTFTDKCNQ